MGNSQLQVYFSTFSCFILREVLLISGAIKSIIPTSLKAHKWANLPKQKTPMFSAGPRANVTNLIEKREPGWTSVFKS